ncbi:MAG: ABC transporter ATP-binding protein [Chloroflexi bacterium]|nr:ABC transporter ATP-binding protein [Chloroflexota bacterium]
MSVNTRGLSKIYGQGRTAVRALEDVNLKIDAGEFIAAMGPSGSGKTTLLNLVGALDRPSAGEVRIGEVEITELTERSLHLVRRHQVGFIFQAFFLVPTLSARENVLLPTLPVGNTTAYERRADELLRLVGLNGRAHRRPSELSAGEQQRVAIARALIMDPGLILGDEPTGNLDSRTGGEVLQLLQRLSQEMGKTFLVATHDPRIARRSDRIVYLRDGQLSPVPTVDITGEY